MTGRSPRRILAPVTGRDPLMDEICALLAGAEEDDDPVRLEPTLNDGYARVLTLESELRRLRARLELLRKRHSAAVHAGRAGRPQTRPERTA
jgi:hypothetical protein